MGRISVDVYPLQVGVPLQKVETFGKYLGGSPSNVAVSAARFGRTSAVITRTGADPFGEYLHEALRGFGVDDRYVSPVPKIPTSSCWRAASTSSTTSPGPGARVTRRSR